MHVVHRHVSRRVIHQQAIVVVVVPVKRRAERRSRRARPVVQLLPAVPVPVVQVTLGPRSDFQLRNWSDDHASFPNSVFRRPYNFSCHIGEPSRIGTVGSTEG